MLTRGLCAPLQFLKHMIHNGVLQDHSVLQKRLSNVLGENTTFEEAYRKTGAHGCPTGGGQSAPPSAQELC